MKSVRSHALLFFMAGVLISLCPVSPEFGGNRETKHVVRLNNQAVEHLKQLIAEGHFVADNRGSWSQHQPSAKQQNELVRTHGFDEYARWHLGIDEGHAPNSKARYKFPCGDFKNVHRCALLAAQYRAAQFHHRDIEAAAISLRKMIEAQGGMDSEE
jgi:hypothetical protein